MKLALCTNCKTIIEAHAPTTPMAFNRCPCGQSHITYTGENNEVAIKGPLVILGVDDEQWNQIALLGRDKRLMPAFVTVPVSSSTVLNMDITLEQEQIKDDATHVRRVDGVYVKLVSVHDDPRDIQAVIIEFADGAQIAMVKGLFDAQYIERNKL